MKPSSIAIVVYDKKILLLLRDDFPSLNDPNSWQLIGGGVEPGESYEEALKREIKEEIGVVAKDISFLGKVVVDGIDAAIFFVRLNKTEAGKIRLGDEGQELKFFAYNEIKDLKLITSLRIYLNLYGKYLFEAIEAGKVPDPQKLGLG